MRSSDSPLHKAVAENDATKVAKLSKVKRWAVARDDLGQSPLHWAARRGFVEILMILIENGAQVDSRDHLGQTPLYFATGADENAGRMIMALRGAGADPFSRTNSGGSPYDLAHLWMDDIASYYSDLPEPRTDGHSPQLVPNVACYATKRLVEENLPVGAMDRMVDDGAWFFSLGTETQAELDNAENVAIYSLQTIAVLDDAIIAYLDAPPGTSLLRQKDGRFIQG